MRASDILHGLADLLSGIESGQSAQQQQPTAQTVMLHSKAMLTVLWPL